MKRTIVEDIRMTLCVCAWAGIITTCAIFAMKDSRRHSLTHGPAAGSPATVTEYDRQLTFWRSNAFYTAGRVIAISAEWHLKKDGPLVTSRTLILADELMQPAYTNTPTR